MDKPKLNEKEEGNLYKAIHWLVENEPEFSFKEFWSHVSKSGQMKKNGFWTVFPINSKNKQLKLFSNHFPTDRILWYVWW